MVFFAIAAVKGASVARHELRKQKERSQIISSSSTAGPTGGNWWGGNGGSYSAPPLDAAPAEGNPSPTDSLVRPASQLAAPASAPGSTNTDNNALVVRDDTPLDMRAALRSAHQALADASNVHANASPPPEQQRPASGSASHPTVQEKPPEVVHSIEKEHKRTPSTSSAVQSTAEEYAELAVSTAAQVEKKISVNTATERKGAPDGSFAAAHTSSRPQHGTTAATSTQRISSTESSSSAARTSPGQAAPPEAQSRPSTTSSLAQSRAITELPAKRSKVPDGSFAAARISPRRDQPSSSPDNEQHPKAVPTAASAASFASVGAQRQLPDSTNNGNSGTHTLTVARTAPPRGPTDSARSAEGSFAAAEAAGSLVSRSSMRAVRTRQGEAADNAARLTKTPSRSFTRTLPSLNEDQPDPAVVSYAALPGTSEAKATSRTQGGSASGPGFIRRGLSLPVSAKDGSFAAAQASSGSAPPVQSAVAAGRKQLRTSLQAPRKATSAVPDGSFAAAESLGKTRSQRASSPGWTASSQSMPDGVKSERQATPASRQGGPDGSFLAADLSTQRSLRNGTPALRMRAQEGSFLATSRDVTSQDNSKPTDRPPMRNEATLNVSAEKPRQRSSSGKGKRPTTAAIGSCSVGRTTAVARTPK